MIKNVIIAVLLIVVLAEGAYIMKEKAQAHTLLAMLASKSSTASPNARPKPVLLEKGMKLSDNPIAKFAHQIYPGTISDDTKKVMTGFNLSTQVQSDKSTLVTLTPKDSDDQDQQYLVKPGEILYFIEQTPVDDKNDQDKDMNYRDDYGIITDANGTVL